MGLNSDWPTTAAALNAGTAAVAAAIAVAATVPAVLVLKCDLYRAVLALEAHAKERRFGRWSFWRWVTNRRQKGCCVFNHLKNRKVIQSESTGAKV